MNGIYIVTSLILANLLFCIYGSYTGNGIRWKALTTALNINFTANVIRRQITQHVGLCGQKCFSDKTCLSFSYDFESNVCQGHNHTYLPKSVFKSQFQRTTGVKYFIAEEFLSGLTFQDGTVDCVDTWYGCVAGGVVGVKINLNGIETEGSSVYEPKDTPNKAVDGDKSTFFHSKLELTTFPFWLAKTDVARAITKVVVYKRIKFKFRFRDITLFVGINKSDFTVCDTYKGPDEDEIKEFICPYPIAGNTVKIEHRGPVADNPRNDDDYRILTLTEVEIYGF